MLAAVNVVVGVVACLWFVPLELHIYSCTSDEKWCHLQAFVFGVPMAVVILILAALTVAITFRFDKPPGSRLRLLTVVAWLPLVIAAGVLVALFAAVVHNL